MDEPSELGADQRRTRRNIMKMGAILASVGFARITTAKAVTLLPCTACKCFLKGTMIETAAGERKVEDLAPGDLMPTMFGGLRPIRFVTRYSLKRSDPAKAWPQDVRPIVIARSALAEGVPNADLYVTGAHSLMIDGLLIPAEELVNGATIRIHDAADSLELEYFNIKVEGHDVIYAQGAAVETLLAVDESAVNFADYFRMYGVPADDVNRCAPRVSNDGGRWALKSRFRSAVSPWVDRREPFDIIRDRLEERSAALAAHETVSV